MDYRNMNYTWQVRYSDLEWNQTLRVMLSRSPEGQRILALRFLTELPEERTEMLKSRVAALSVERFSELLEEMNGLSDRMLLQYLELFTLPNFESSCPRYTQEELAIERRECEEKKNAEIALQPPFLPAELSLMVLDKFYEAVFIPGEIEPNCVVNDGDDYFFDNRNYFYHHLEKLRLLDTALCNEYKERYWSENIFISGPGSFDNTLRVFWHVPQDDLLKIRSVRLIISRKGGRYRFQSYNQQIDLLDNLKEPQSHLADSDREDEFNWNMNAGEIFKLKLDHLVLDVSHAYSLDGSYLGLSFARRAPLFAYGVPKTFEVIAPSLTIAKGVRRILEDRNVSR